MPNPLSAEDQAKLAAAEAEVVRLKALAVAPAGTAAALAATAPASIEVPAPAPAAAAPAPAPAATIAPAPASASAQTPPASAASPAQPAAAAPGMDPNEEDIDEDEELDVDATNTNNTLNPNAAGAAAPKRTASTVISELCIMNGKPEMAAQLMLDFAANKTTVAKIREDFLASRATESHANMTSPHHSSGVNGGSPLDKMDQLAITLAQNSGGKLSKTRAYEQVLLQNPLLYEDYEDERAQAVKGGFKTKRQYIAQMAPRFQAMGLGTLTTMGTDNLPR